MNTNPRIAGLRKAAILVSSLDMHLADRVLEQMGPEQSQLVRQMMVEIDEIDPAEQDRIIKEFCRVGPLVPDKCPPGIELDDRLARRFVRPAVSTSSAQSSSVSKESPFRFLRDAEADKLVKILVTERPQTIALVLSHLPPEQAGKILVRLAPSLQIDVIRRLVDLEETDPEILQEVERGLESRLSEQVRMQRRRVAGLSAVEGILKASEQAVGMKILENLATRDRMLAERLGPDRIDFEDLLELDDRELGRLVEGAERELVVLALVGAPPHWTDRFLSHYSEAEARAIRYRLEHLGPLRLSDAEEARTRLADLARRLAVQGKMRLPRKAHAAAFA